MLGERYRDALHFVAELHQGQLRKGSEVDYIAHLLSVSALVIEHGGDEDEAIAALLHDAIEDQGDGYSNRSGVGPRGGRPALRREIVRRFGEPVRRIVDACTDDDVFAKPAPGEPGTVEAWKERKAHHIARLASERDVAIVRVACADKLHNARSMIIDAQQHGDDFWSRFRARTKSNQLWYYRGMAKAIRQCANATRDDGLIRLVDELDRTLDRLDATDTQARERIRGPRRPPTG